MENKKGFLVVSKEVRGDVHIVKNTQYNHIKASKVTVGENVTARLYGEISESLTLKKGSRIFIHGTITGSINNEGGELNIYR